jgi:5-methylcytosine-specific restriction endonuclease McrA
MQSGLEAFSERHYYKALKEQRKHDFDGCCAYCGLSPNFLTIDHVVPRSQGGTNDPNNLLPACKPCNESKGSQSLHGWYSKNNHRFSDERWLKIIQVLFHNNSKSH